MSDPLDHEALATSMAQGAADQAARVESRTRRRLALLYVALIVCASVILAYVLGQQRTLAATQRAQTRTQQIAEQTREATDRQNRAFQHAIVQECVQSRANVVVINRFVTGLIHTYQSSPVLNKAQRADRVRQFSGLRQTVPTCPPDVTP